jgi:hypothetical protein
MKVLKSLQYDFKKTEWPSYADSSKTMPQRDTVAGEAYERSSV